MGSFNATCIVSNLAIEHGTPVRFLALTQNRFHKLNEHICYVSGRWQLRGPPLRAEYNDYGSIEHIKNRLVNRVFFESLSGDCVEMGMGDNTCHDVPVRRGMSTQQWLTALWEGRVFVTDDRKWSAEEIAEWNVKHPRPEPKEAGVPTMGRLEKALRNAGLAVASEDEATGYLVSDVTYGFLRVRWGRSYDRELDPLQKAVAAIEAAGFAAMITCGTGMYKNHAEVLVAPKPPPEGESYAFADGLVRNNHMDNRDRPVSQAMIREDVWQILLKTTAGRWDGDSTFAELQKAANKAVDDELRWKAEEEAFDKRTDLTKEQIIDFKMKQWRRHDDLWRGEDEERNPFRGGLRAQEGVSGFSLKQAFDLGLKLHESKAELDGFIQDMAETVYVQWIYSQLHGQWQPTTNSNQEGGWEEHRAFMRSILEIKGKWEDE